MDQISTISVLTIFFNLLQMKPREMLSKMNLRKFTSMLKKV